MKVHGVPVYFDPACRTVAQARGVWPFYRIVVGREWYALSGETRAALLLHEVGHCKAHHAIKRLLTVPLVLVWALGERCREFSCLLAQQQELAADRYAADHGFARELAHALERHDSPESPFYPNRDVRRAILLARHCKEKMPC